MNDEYFAIFMRGVFAHYTISALYHHYGSDDQIFLKPRISIRKKPPGIPS